jgi:hypothetical protein
MITYQEVLLNKFVFSQITLDPSFSDFIWSLDFPDTGKVDGEIQFKLQKVTSQIKSAILDCLVRLEMDAYLRNAITEFEFDINKMQKGEWIPMHNEVSQKSPFEVILWLTKTDQYVGREFVMEGPEIDRSIQPKNGTVCLLDTTTPDIFHGVKALESDTEIISITGGLGRKSHYA